jgi:hypothetical protein
MQRKASGDAAFAAAKKTMEKGFLFENNLKSPSLLLFTAKWAGSTQGVVFQLGFR